MGPFCLREVELALVDAVNTKETECQIQERNTTFSAILRDGELWIVFSGCHNL